MIKEKLRAQFDQRRQQWKIVKKTTFGAGGWRRFGTNWYYTRKAAETAIKIIVGTHGDYYEEDK